MRRKVVVLLLIVMLVGIKTEESNGKGKRRELLGPTDSSKWTVSGGGIGASVQILYQMSSLRLRI